MDLPLGAIAVLKDTIDLLVAHEYDKLEADGRIGRLTVTQLQTAVQNYRRKLIPVPEQGLESAHIYPVDESSPPEWVVEVDMWTVEEGMSDLTLSVTITENDVDSYRLRINDLHVL